MSAAQTSSPSGKMLQGAIPLQYLALAKPLFSIEERDLFYTGQPAYASNRSITVTPGLM